jgi:hypothetical protein
LYKTKIDEWRPAAEVIGIAVYRPSHADDRQFCPAEAGMI